MQGDDTALLDLQTQDAEQSAVLVSHRHRRLAVGDHRLELRSQQPAPARQPGEEPGDGRPDERRADRRRLAAAVAVEDDVVGEHPFQGFGVSAPNRVEEPSGQVLLLGSRRLEARACLVDVSPGAGVQLSARGLAE